MSQFFNVFGRSRVVPATTAIVDFAEDSWYGDEPLTARSEPVDGGDPAWEFLELTLPGVRRPVRLEPDLDDEAVDELLSEARDEMDDGTRRAVEGRLTGIRQVIGVEIFPEDFDDDAWEFLDVLLGFLARQIDGTVVTDDGAYDENLQRLPAAP